MKHLLAILLALLPLGALAQEVKLPAEIRGLPGAWIIVAPEVISGGAPKWRIDAGLQEVRLDLLFPPEVAKQARGKVFQSATGRFKVEVWNAKADVPSEIVTCWLVIGDPGPVVPPINPPVDPPVKPIAGMRVLMIYESDTPLPKGIYDTMQSPAVEEYLRTHCLKGPDGKTPERRKLDDDDPLTGLSQAWRDLRAKFPVNLPPGASGYPDPQIAIGDSSGVVAFSGTIPNGEAAFLELLKKYGGN